MRNIFLASFLLSIIACNTKFKEKVGLSTTGPDEYQTQKAKSLEIPPHYELNAPTND